MFLGLYCTHKLSNHTTVQYGRGTLGVHIWELTGHRVNSTINVSTTYKPQKQASTHHITVDKRRKHTLLPLPRQRQALSPLLLPPLITHTMVQTMCVRKHVPRRRI
jgi:hypothetical protein